MPTKKSPALVAKKKSPGLVSGKKAPARVSTLRKRPRIPQKRLSQLLVHLLSPSVMPLNYHTDAICREHR